MGEVQGLLAQASALRDEAKRFRRDAVGASNDLVAVAERAYDAGEMDLLEVLDAHRSALAAELQALDIEESARRAVIELSRSTGAEP